MRGVSKAQPAHSGASRQADHRGQGFVDAVVDVEVGQRIEGFVRACAAAQQLADLPEQALNPARRLAERAGRTPGPTRGATDTSRDLPGMAEHVSRGWRPCDARQPRQRNGRRRDGVRDAADPARDVVRAPGERADLPCDACRPAQPAADHAGRTPDAAQQSSDEFIVVRRVESVGQLFFECVPERHVVDAIHVVGQILARIALLRIDGEVTTFVERFVAE
ncbi:hypothetical protein WI89_13050 [Burkholderia ubonensis]|nr:hypothetical protein WI89_13050 [Burkholderia ubonensis]